MKCSRFEELMAGGTRLDREGIEHVLACDSCRELWITSKLVEEASALPGKGGLISPPEPLERRVIARGERGAARRGRPLLLWAGALSAAAGLVFVAFGLTLLIREPDAGRGAAADSHLRGTMAQAPRLVEPRGEVDSPSALSFRWEATSAAHYRLVVMDLSSGATVIEVETDATGYVPDAEQLARLRRGTDYTWIVEPLGPGDDLPSEAIVFRLAP